jgi:hypothetical protein
METQSNHIQTEGKQVPSENQIINKHIEELQAELRLCYRALAVIDVCQQIKAFLRVIEDQEPLYSIPNRFKENDNAKEQIKQMTDSTGNSASEKPTPHEPLRQPTLKKQYEKAVDISNSKASADPKDPFYIPAEGLLIGTDTEGKPVYF